ncbi:hypothetical protein [Aeromonas enteropelogenes]|uniref:hypothetical protein n=1 Tax=Aeromonas enteropelogenes TaxID=29489 RepID=UPI003BA1BD3E
MTTFELDIRLTKIFTSTATATDPRMLAVAIRRLGRFAVLANGRGAARLAGEALRYQAQLKQELSTNDPQ